MSIEERVAEIVVDHHPDPTTDGDTCMCGWDPARHLSADTYEEHVARVFVTELGLIEQEDINAYGARITRYVTPWETT